MSVSAYSQVGDVNGDDQVDVWDLYLFARSWYKTPGEPGYNPNADFTGDGKINLADLVKLSKNWYVGVPRPEGPPTVTPGYATVSIYPSLVEGPDVSDTFTVDINIDNVTDLYAWSIGLSWDPSILNCTGSTNNYTFFGSGIEENVIPLAGTVNNTAGEIYPPRAASRNSRVNNGVTGSGALFHAEFTVLSEGSTWINFTQLTLLNSTGESMPFDLVNSYFSLYPTEHRGPTAKFSYSPAAPKVNEAVNFDALPSSPGWDGTAPTSIVSYSWKFGDGTTGTGVTPTHTYTSKGTYTVTLNVTDSQGLWNTTSKTITVSPPQTTIFICPSYITGYAVDNFTIDINIEGVEDLYAWLISLSWNSSVLECLSFTYDYSFFGPKADVVTAPGTINNTAGEIQEYTAALVTLFGVTGSGTLAQVEFHVLSNGSTSINLMATLLNSSELDIPHTVVNGYFTDPPRLRGDANGDNKVDLRDLVILAKSWCREIGDPRYDARADFTNDGKVDLRDLVALAKNWNKGVS